jgi:hypothetical protein
MLHFLYQKKKQRKASREELETSNKYSFEQNQQTETFLSWYQSSLSFETKKGAKILLFHKVGL